MLLAGVLSATTLGCFNQTTGSGPAGGGGDGAGGEGAGGDGAGAQGAGGEGAGGSDGECPATPPNLGDVDSCPDYAPCFYEVNGCPTNFVCGNIERDLDDELLQWGTANGAEHGDPCTEVGKVCEWELSYEDGGPYGFDRAECSADGTWNVYECFDNNPIEGGSCDELTEGESCGEGLPFCEASSCLTDIGCGPLEVAITCEGGVIVLSDVSCPP